VRTLPCIINETCLYGGVVVNFYGPTSCKDIFTKWDALGGAKLIMQERTMYLSYNIFSKPFTIQSIIQPSNLHNEYLSKWKGFQVRPFSYGEQLKQLNSTHLKFIPSTKGSKDSTYHTHVEVEKEVGTFCYLCWLQSSSSPPPRWGMFSYICGSNPPLSPKGGGCFLTYVVPIPLFPQKVDILLRILRWGYCWLTPLLQRKGTSEGIPKTKGLRTYRDSCGGH